MRNDFRESVERADPAERTAAYEAFYDRAGANAILAQPEVSIPSRRRKRRIRLYRSIIGSNPGTVLEIGCGKGDLTCEIAAQATRVIGIDLSSSQLNVARARAERIPGLAERVAFQKMNAVRLDFPDSSFDLAISTSMLEHLHCDDVDIHLREVWRILKPYGRYLIWCPNRLGHHKDRPFHLCMLSHRELRTRMEAAGFCDFRSPILTGRPMVGAGVKIAMETTMSALRIPILWSHLGVRNILMVAAKKPFTADARSC